MFAKAFRAAEVSVLLLLVFRSLRRKRRAQTQEHMDYLKLIKGIEGKVGDVSVTRWRDVYSAPTPSMDISNLMRGQVIRVPVSFNQR